MLHRALRVGPLFVIVMSWSHVASAQWYVNPYVGQVTKVESPFAGEFLVASPPDQATVFGVAGGTNPFKRLGLEIDYQRINHLFRREESAGNLDEGLIVGDNHLQSITAAAHFGRPFGANARARLYGVAGGGLNIVSLGQDVGLDFETFFGLSPAQQTTIENCVNALGPDTPTLAQLQGCNVPLVAEDVSGYRAVLTFGGGVVLRLAKHLATKVDLRYFMEVPEDPAGPFTFWRFTVGVVLHR